MKLMNPVLLFRPVYLRSVDFTYFDKKKRASFLHRGSVGVHWDQINMAIASVYDSRSTDYKTLQKTGRRYRVRGE